MFHRATPRLNRYNYCNSKCCKLRFKHFSRQQQSRRVPDTDCLHFTASVFFLYHLSWPPVCSCCSRHWANVIAEPNYTPCVLTCSCHEHQSHSQSGPRERKYCRQQGLWIMWRNLECWVCFLTYIVGHVEHSLNSCTSIQQSHLTKPHCQQSSRALQLRG